MLATCRADETQPFTTARGSLDGGTFEGKAPTGARLELSEPPELGAFAFFQVGDDLADDVVQASRRPWLSKRVCFARRPASSAFFIPIHANKGAKEHSRFAFWVTGWLES